MTTPSRPLPPPGYHPDPWGVVPFRWWDGHCWTLDVATRWRRGNRPWTSIAMIVMAVIVSPLLAWAVVNDPGSAALAGVPAMIVIPVLRWLDRVEPEPRSARLHALLWGALVAIPISSLVNTTIADAFGVETAAVVSAPLIEEATKGVAVLWSVQRRELDGVMDGVVYAGWAALGFAVVEDFFYFADANQVGMLWQVFVIRALLTPFAHGLFTVWTGLGIGIAVARGKSPLVGGLAGYPLAVGAHMAWNGTLTAAEDPSGQALLPIMVLLFVALFVVGMSVLVLVRRREQRRFVELAPWLARYYGLTPEEVTVFANWRGMLATRRALPRDRRKAFDRMHATLARLVHIHDQPSPTDPVTEQVLVGQLHHARLEARA